MQTLRFTDRLYNLECTIFVYHSRIANLFLQVFLYIKKYKGLVDLNKFLRFPEYLFSTLCSF